MYSFLTSTSWTHPRDRPHELTLKITAVKGLWSFGPACCAPAARAGYLSFRATGAKETARDHLKIIKIPFKNILQHLLSINLPLESSKPLEINAVKGLWAFGPACCAPAARAGYVSFRAPGAKKHPETSLGRFKHDLRTSFIIL